MQLVSPALVLEPGITNASTSLAFVDVDGDDAHNQSPKAQPEDGEFIEPFTLPIDARLLENLVEHANKRNAIIDCKVYTYCIGMLHALK